MKEPPLLRVEWVDSALIGAQWWETDELNTATAPIVSVGFKVKIEDGMLYLAGSWNPSERHLPWAQVIAIPESAIVKKRRIGH
ncbi:hypothetical protein LCGC14_1909360 [marine sediment metagenome]|uniref:Uncharacterized protein n=1 Tax=marine sediment metagenome TaxID=412755 RepID=A0A0F9FUN0_9ZZZZ